MPGQALLPRLARQHKLDAMGKENKKEKDISKTDWKG